MLLNFIFFVFLSESSDEKRINKYEY
jgi:hypothetical protein